MLKAVGILITLSTLSHLSYADSHWPPQTGAKVAGNALEYPTVLKAEQKPLSEFLNQGAKIVSTQIEDTGPVLTLQHGKKSLICFVYPANSSSDQNVATSKCYGLN
ncbi:hypothetical protein [Acinetobacter boissieri]|uniref:Uncharacterized protein n=1 Tax=Acinetobacter boissieri TaxID=1219383 RepID=A0A1G6GIS2_9GAMM|nr:hypothetical protein [Acinetobacter boissieri]SDB81907.1 hypothetical protein SAMN05421733_101233 [Acinetobacter boissieri]